jgi:putative peptide zinc metalloprotease protein
VRRADGQTVQLTPLLYALLGEIDGHRTYREIASVVGERIGKVVAPQHVRFLVEKKLSPLGLVGAPDGSEPVLKRANPLLALRPRFVVTNQRVTRWIATPFAIMFFPPVVVGFVAAFLVTNAWLYFERGLAPAVRHALYEPSLLLMVFALTLLSAGFHELGHAAACRYGGGKPGAMGVGLYLIWPAFYTDVTDAYRLDRRSRLRVDLGGVYFNAVFAVGAFGLWAATGWEALLVVIPLQLFAMARQLLPLVRLDGYHVLADLTGVPDLFAHIKPILAGMLPWRWGTPASRQLRPSVRAIVTAWVLMVVPLLAFMFVTIIVTLPRLAATAWDSAGIKWHEATASWAGGEPAAASVSFLSMLAIAIPILSMSYLVVRVSRRMIRRVWRGTSGRPVMRGVAALVATCMLAMVATAWWPDGQYRPLQSTDRGAVDVRFRFSDSLLYERVLGWIGSEEQRGPTSLPASGMESTEATTGTDATRSGARSGGDADLAGGTDSAPIFRFTEPEPPGEGDNQALAVNYADGSSIVDVALSLIFDPDDLVDQKNEAWALASCSDCSTTAIAFQVLLILEEADVVVPQNIAVAVNVLCTECVTYALAMQTIFTLSQPLSEAAQLELASVWRTLEVLMDNIEDIPLEQLYPLLLAIQQQIIDIVDEEVATGAVIEGSTAEAGVVPSGSPSPDDGSDPAADGDGSAETTSEPSPTAEPSPEPTEEPTPEPTEEPTPAPTP